MKLHEVLVPQGVEVAVKASSKKQLLQHSARRLASLTAYDEREINQQLQAREKLGSTAVGGGVAIPHARLESLDAPMLYVAVMDAPIDFEAIDDQPVDLVAVLLAPLDSSSEHLKTLSRISRLLRDEHLCSRLRGAASADAAFAILTEDKALSYAAA